MTVQLMWPSTVLNGSASAMSSISGLNTYSIRSLCTLRERRHRRPRNTRYRAARYDLTRAGLPPAETRQLAWRTNTRYRAPATAYSGRTFTGWIAPASWRTNRIQKIVRGRDPAVTAPARSMRGHAVSRIAARNVACRCATGHSHQIRRPEKPRSPESSIRVRTA